MTTSRPVLMPPSVRRVTRWRSRLRVRIWLTSERPISQGVPAYLIEVWGEAPVPPTWPETRITSALALATPAAIVPMPASETSFTHDPGVGVDLLQVVDELGQVLDRVDVVVRRRRDQGDAGRGVAQAGDLDRDLEARQLAALAGLGTLGDLDLQLPGGVEVFGGDAEAARGHLLDRRVGVVAVGARVEALLALAALAAVGAGADPVHGDGQRLVRLGREGAQGHAGGDEALPDLGDALDLVERHRRQLAVEVEQVADRDRVLRVRASRRSACRRGSCRWRPRAGAGGSPWLPACGSRRRGGSGRSRRWRAAARPRRRRGRAARAPSS